MRTIYRHWKEIAEKIGNFQAMILFSILYFLLLTPIGLFTSLIKDYLGKKSGPSWDKIKVNTTDIKMMERQ